MTGAVGLSHIHGRLIATVCWQIPRDLGSWHCKRSV